MARTNRAAVKLGWREQNREARKFLRDICDSQWGYVIYRTVYTAESDSV
jgi:hypothetical protein